MKKIFVLIATLGAIAGLLFSNIIAGAAPKPAQPITLAIYGDWPYSSSLLAQAPALLNSVNSDPNVSLVIHVGDIHSGSMACTGAGLNPIPAGSVPAWNQGIYNIFQQFNDTLVYTPGDNQWTEGHKTNESASGAPPTAPAAPPTLSFPPPDLTISV